VHGQYYKNITTFPSSCAPYAENGCTRIVQADSGCINQGTIPTTNYTVFDINTDDFQSINNVIEECTQQVNGAKLQSPSNLEDLSSLPQLVHITFQSTICGFLDDMFINVFYDELIQGVVVNFNSQLRIGSYDFEQNYDHVSKMLTCIDNL